MDGVRDDSAKGDEDDSVTPQSGAVPATVTEDGPEATQPVQEEQENSKEDAMVVVERSPTPPLPDFHLDETLLDQLQRKLKLETEGMNVEQLEQLRATCLGDVWRHRKEWDRDDLVKALFKVVDDFLEEVKELQEWENDD